MRTRLSVLALLTGLVVWPATTAGGSCTVSSQAVWPSVSHADFATPRALTTAFATTYLGFRAPVVGAYRAGDNMSGEVPVRASAKGVETTVLVRKLGTLHHWYVIGAIGATIDITSPTTHGAVTSPFTARGRSTAYEGVVNVSLRTTGNVVLAHATALGGSMGTVAPFASRLTFLIDCPTYVNLVVRERSARDGSTAVASVIRVLAY